MIRAQAMQEMDRAAGCGRIAVQRCLACDAMQYPPREICAACLEDAFEWRSSSDLAGTVMAATVLHHSFDAAFRDRLPLRVGLVQIGVGAVAVCFLDPSCRAGDAVRVTARLDADGHAVLRAAPSDDAR